MNFTIIIISFISLNIILNNIIFLKPIPACLSQAKYEFNLTTEDVRYVRHFFSKKSKSFNFAKLPTNTHRKKLNSFFLILKNRNHPSWAKAYVYLGELIPEFFEGELDC